MKVYVNYDDNRWKKYNIDFEQIANAVVGRTRHDAEVSITLTNDKEIHQLNRQYRNIDKPTNVLSFELGDDLLLGDIYISLDTVMREAADADISVSEHTAHMIVHGVLHLLGYDHLNNRQARVMEGKEVKILKTLGIKNPYKDENTVKHSNSIFKYIISGVCGICAALGFAPFNLWWLSVIAIGVMYYIATREYKSVLYAWFLALPFGACYAIAMFWWVLNSIYVIPELTQQFAVWTIPGVIGIGLFGAIFFTIPFVFVSAIRMKSGVKPILFAASWMLVLWLREWIFTGFPWNPFANIFINILPVANSMALWGAVGLSFVAIGLIASLVGVLRNRKCGFCWITFLSFVALMGIGAIAGSSNMLYAEYGADAPMPIIRIVQPATDQDEKTPFAVFDRMTRAQNRMNDLIQMASENVPDIVVYPETTYPFFVRSQDAMPMARALKTNVVAGANSVSDGKVYNSMIVANSSGDITNIYSKSHLVPFGEYSPLGFMPSPSDLTAGRGPELISIYYGDDQEFLFAPAVCYEVIFSNSLVGRDDLDAIVNITNDNWFGNTPGVYQHLDMVRRYAIESGLPIVRANYSGISAFVLSDGSVISSLPVGVRGTLDGFVWGAHLTPYRYIGLNGWVIIILLFSILMVGFSGGARDE